MTGTVNRILLAVAGAVLLAAGVVLLTAVRPLGGRAAPLLSAADRRRYLHADGWTWWVLIAALVVCLLLALWWLLAQLKRARLRTVAVDTGDGGFAVLRGRALSDAVAAEAGALDGVAGCRVALRGRRGSPALRVAFELEPHAVPADTLAGLAGPVLSHARTSAGLPDLAADARFKVTSHRARRVT
ncbi:MULTISPECIES: alkaline shock response membrane anchor protein AmaP [unclassified Streptomyces]|uniref:alkaline shock response membrane anchor protein AmaP n=1 Tax=unclassified Streptomyces TaxID=2593676 RepID=UPI0005ECB647|nr:MULTISPECIES: alkaline shock response membrane anchor protein AmaP [unclassified Streptomyces]APU39724.1 hypothetical protein BSL84_08010 [Streptomyces sp. TN58]KJK49815.1 hypothetical protein UK14_14685 [Streptomyces sp. NRRL F-4428]